MEDIDWLRVILDYGKRFPTVTTDDLNLNIRHICLPIPISMLRDDKSGWLVYGFGGECVFSVNEKLRYASDVKHDGTYDWKPVPDHIKLRLLTEGKEDLI